METKNDWTKVDSMEEFEEWLKEGGWETVQQFVDDTGVTAEELIGTWFFVMQDRVYTTSDPDAAWPGISR